MDTSPTYRRTSRAAGVIGLALLALVVIQTGGPFFTDASRAEIVGWVRRHPTALYLEGLRTWVMILLVAAFIATLLWRTGRRGLAVPVVYAFLTANLAVDMVWAGTYYGLARAGQMHAPGGGLLTLFAVVQELTFTDGIWFGAALLVVSVLALRTRTLPRPIAWLGVLCALVHVLGLPVQVALTGTVEGVSGPVSAVSFVFWVLATTVTLLVRPGRAPEPASAARAEVAAA
jgi:hypothetical protein